jgi:integrase
VKLTSSTIEILTCPSGKKDVTYFDDAMPGFGLRCRGSGVRRYVVQFELNGYTRRITIGPPEVFSLEEARRIARTHLAKKALGQDPAVERAEARSAAKHTLGAVIEEYLAARQATLRPQTLRYLQRYLRAWWKPLHPIPIGKLTRRDIAPYLNGPPSAAGRARSCLMACCKWVIEQGLIDANPVVGTGSPDRHIGPRERVLTSEELVAIWKASEADQFAYGTIVRLLMITGARRQEVGSMAWDELDRKAGTWTIPAARAKNKRDHTLPLPFLAWRLIDDWQARGAFPDRLFSKAGFGTWAVSKRALDRRCSVAPWALHDIRRSVATHLGDMGVAPHTIEAILGHQTGSRVARTYNRSVYLNEMRTALALWADRIEAFVEGGERKIIPLRPQ